MYWYVHVSVSLYSLPEFPPATLASLNGAAAPTRSAALQTEILSVYLAENIQTCTLRT